MAVMISEAEVVKEPDCVALTFISLLSANTIQSLFVNTFIRPHAIGVNNAQTVDIYRLNNSS